MRENHAERTAGRIIMGKGVLISVMMVGLMLKDATVDNLSKADAMLNKLRAIRQPVDTALFAGKLDIAKLKQPWRFFFRKNTEMAEGDFRDWEAIRKWAEELADKL